MSNENKSNEPAKAAGAAVAGGVAGAATSAVVGGMGLSVGGTAVAIGAAPVIAVGVVVGLAGYGIYRIFKKCATSPPALTAAIKSPPPRKPARVVVTPLELWPR